MCKVIKITYSLMALTFFFNLPLVAQAPFNLEAEAKAIISRQCLNCHNPQQKSSGLDLSSRKLALQGGGSGRTILLPGKPEESLMIARVVAGEMPLGNPLSQEEIQTLRRWARAGAPWSGILISPQSNRPRAGANWWAFQPLANHPPPQAKGISSAWDKSPIDQFVYAKLYEKKMRPSPPASRRVMIRRATFDLLGLPPSPEEIDFFLNDPRENAYESLIDRLLASPHYGERWGRHWLDVSRFGESHGYEQNRIREKAWPYRDYIIRSFNENKPFNRMILEQIAGDQIEPNNPKIGVATGFLVAGIHDTVTNMNMEAKLQQRVNDLDDMILTTGAAFLGLTINCARCHDHKFDPIKQSDYYRFQATFAGVHHGERSLATPEQKRHQKNLKEPLERELKTIQSRLASMRKEGASRVVKHQDKITQQYLPPLDPILTEEIFTPVQARFIRMTIHKTATVYANETVYKNSTPALDELEVWTEGPSPKNVALEKNGAKSSAKTTRNPAGDFSPYSTHHINDGKFDKLWISGEQGKGRVTIELPKIEYISRIIWSRDRLGPSLGNRDFFVPTKYTFDVSLNGKDWMQVVNSNDRLPYSKDDREKLFLMSIFKTEEQDEWNSLENRKVEINEDLKAIPKLPAAYIGQFKEPEEPTRLLKRGDPMNKGEVIPPGSLSAFKSLLPEYKLNPKTPEGARRLTLARWISDNRNSLTARVLANRLWHYHFGNGLVDTPSDFGFNGSLPTHPMLLDWLARRIHHHGWRLKPLHREIMLSATYRQASLNSQKFIRVDNESRFLWRFPPRRLEAEEIRDTILAVSGKLDLEMGGPGFRLYEYKVDNVASYYPLENPGKDVYRRGVYHQTARSVKVDLLGPYDCPDSTLPTPKRQTTTSPLQALSLLNSKFLIDQAQFLAARLASEIGTTNISGQINRAYLLAFGRMPNSEEEAAGITLIRKHGLFIFCRVLLNANEFIYVM